MEDVAEAGRPAGDAWGEAPVDVALPRGWAAIDPPGDAAFVAVGCSAGDGPAPRVVVTLDTLDTLDTLAAGDDCGGGAGNVGGIDLPAWQDAVGAALAARLPSYVLLDLEHAALLGLPAIRRIYTYTGPDGEMTAESWSALDGRVGYGLTWAVATRDYPALSSDADDWPQRLSVGSR